jgi:hypothetical protein
VVGGCALGSAGEVDCLTGCSLTVAEMALILLRMRCSEAEVERVFARLRRLFGDHVRHSLGDLVESRLTIMMNNLDVTTDFMRGLSEMEQKVLGAPLRH